MTRYTAMAGMSGCMPNFCEDADSYEDAVEMLVSLHELGKNRARLLKRDGYLVLNLHRDGNEYCEVVQAEEGKEMKVRAIFDNGGETFDRYTVVYSTKTGDYFDGRGMSEHPCHPQGFGLCCEVSPLHLTDPKTPLGKRIRFEDLPPDCQRLISRDLED